MSTRTRTVAAAVAIAFAGGGLVATSAVAAPTPAPAAAPTASLPSGCHVTIGEATGEAYLEGRKLSAWKRLRLPKKSPRFTQVESLIEDDRWHHLAVDADGKAYDSTVELGGFGDGFDIDVLVGPMKSIGTTLPGIVDLQSGTVMRDADGIPIEATRLVYAVTKNGTMHALPLTHSKSSMRLGRPIDLKAKGLNGIRGIELLGRQWDRRRITHDILLAHTADGRLLQLTVDRTKKAPTVSVKQIAKGWGKVSTLAVGWCSTKPHQSTAVIVAVDSSRRVTAYLDPVWNDASLKGAKTINLGTWRRGAVSTLF